ncbi:S41 family peptidase [Duganella aceris]|uniref:Tail specific protease domain-containing protein n=1 Tax=Duganella aceris TaxID=2703883 RepID=A0ABX0FJY1_9BURK|nr:S41 family peptidase [Duganella aceris]NGZ84880.1 hypothetical protein [Duganella aceris]
MARRLAALLPLLFAAATALAAASDTATAVATTAGTPQTPDQWRRAASADIEAAYQITLANHPGVHDPANPQFAAKLDEARKRGLALAARVTEVGGYVAALQLFNTQIHDGHAGVVPQQSLRTPWRSPGFLTAWRGDSLYVAASEPDGPPVGARVDDCDGKPLKPLIESNVFAFSQRSDELGHWWVYARDVFVDKNNPFIALPAQCRFSADGKSFTRTLAWRTITPKMQQWRNQSYNGATLPVGLTEPRARLYWVAMPSFQPDAAQRDAYRAMTAEVAQHRQRYLDADAVVIDLRDNQGGSSIWSRDFAKALWGQARFERRDTARSAGQQVWWRASEGNTAHARYIVGVLKDEKQEDYAAEMTRIADGMQAAQARGEKFFVNQSEASGTATAADRAEDLPGDAPAFSKPVYVIVPGQCASACLDALDYFTMFPNTKLIGAPSAADSTYMEIRMQPLASGLASVIVPNKVYVNRPRKSGQFYTPSIYENALVWSQPAFLKTIEADLAKR